MEFKTINNLCYWVKAGKKQSRWDVKNKHTRKPGKIINPLLFRRG